MVDQVDRAELRRLVDAERQALAEMQASVGKDGADVTKLDAWIKASGKMATAARVHFPALLDDLYAADLARVTPVAALSPQTLPAPGEVDYAEAARVMFEASGDRFMRAEQCYPAIDALVTAQFIVPSNASTVPSSPTLATVAAANDEGGIEAAFRAGHRAARIRYAPAEPNGPTRYENVDWVDWDAATSRSQHEGASS